MPATLKLGQVYHSLMSSRDGARPEREQLNPESHAILHGVHHLSHEEENIGVLILDDDKEGPVELDGQMLRPGALFRRGGYRTFCRILIDAENSLMYDLEGRDTGPV